MKNKRRMVFILSVSISASMSVSREVSCLINATEISVN